MFKLGIPDCEEKVREKGLCFKCLLTGHYSKRKGKVKCTLCNGYHIGLFCRSGKPLLGAH